MSRSKNISAAARAHSNLCVFGAIVAMLEGGVIEGLSAEKAKEKIIRICKQEQQRQLTLFDQAAHKILRDQS